MDENKSPVKKVFGIIGTVIFFLSYLPFVLLVYSGIEGVQAGLFGGRYIFGFDAMWNIFLWFCLIPVFPVCILYQLIFGIAYIRKHKTLKYVTIAIVASLVVIISIVGFVHLGKEHQQIEEDRGEITSYLSERYGEEMASDISIRVYDSYDEEYMVSTHVLPDGAEFLVYLNGGCDELMNTFNSYNEGFYDDYADYIGDLYDLPDNYKVQVIMDRVDFGSYRDGEDYAILFDDADYRIHGLEVDLEDMTDNEATDLIYEVWENQLPEMANHLDLDFFCLYIRDNGQFAYSVVYYMNSGTARVDSYTNYSGPRGLEGQEFNLP